MTSCSSGLPAVSVRRRGWSRCGPSSIGRCRPSGLDRAAAFRSAHGLDQLSHGDHGQRRGRGGLRHHLKLRTASPSARIAFALHTNAGSLEGIERGTLDCAVGMFPALPREVHVQGLRTDRYVCVMRRGHDLSRRMSLDQFVEAAHVLVTPSGQDLGVVDGWLSACRAAPGRSSPWSIGSPTRFASWRKAIS